MLYILQYFMSVKYFIEIFLNLFLQHGDIETNPVQGLTTHNILAFAIGT